MNQLIPLEKEAVALSIDGSKFAQKLLSNQTLTKDEVNAVVLKYNKLLNSNLFGDRGQFDGPEEVKRMLLSGDKDQIQAGIRALGTLFDEVKEKYTSINS